MLKIVEGINVFHGSGSQDRSGSCNSRLIDDQEYCHYSKLFLHCLRNGLSSILPLLSNTGLKVWRRETEFDDMNIWFILSSKEKVSKVAWKNNLSNFLLQVSWWGIHSRQRNLHHVWLWGSVTKQPGVHSVMLCSHQVGLTSSLSTCLPWKNRVLEQFFSKLMYFSIDFALLETFMP